MQRKTHRKRRSREDNQLEVRRQADELKQAKQWNQKEREGNPLLKHMFPSPLENAEVKCKKDINRQNDDRVESENNGEIPWEKVEHDEKREKKKRQRGYNSEKRKHAFEGELSAEMSIQKRKQASMDKDVRHANTSRASRLEEMEHQREERVITDSPVQHSSVTTDIATGESSNEKRKMEGHEEDGNLNIGSTSGRRGKKRRKKETMNRALDQELKETGNARNSSGETLTTELQTAVDDSNTGTRGTNKVVRNSCGRTDAKQNKSCKNVRFSEQVQVFPSDDSYSAETVGSVDLVIGSRFTEEENAMIMAAVMDYIDVHGLGEKGLEMVMNSRRYSKVRDCWKDIGAALPWRPRASVYRRAHVLFERTMDRGWSSEELEIIKRFHENFGSNWKELGRVLHRCRHHLKDTWRRIRLSTYQSGPWSQKEYQTLFDLVNMDLELKASAAMINEVKSSNPMLRSDIHWQAISSRLSTRSEMRCCNKWYNQLTSSMIAEGTWSVIDDYRLLAALMKLDACCPEAVDWDNLLDNRAGDVCFRRWNQMTKYIGEYKGKPFTEQVEVLVGRYCPKLLEELPAAVATEDASAGLGHDEVY